MVSCDGGNAKSNFEDFFFFLFSFFNELSFAGLGFHQYTEDMEYNLHYSVSHMAVLPTLCQPSSPTPGLIDWQPQAGAHG